MNPIILIPTRLGSTRLPDKPLADIAGKPMVVHVADRAVEAAIGEVVIACDHPTIKQVTEAHGHRAVLTRGDHHSGSDRIFEAVQALDPDGAFDVVVNVQGDLPTIAAHDIAAALAPLEEPACDIATLGSVITDEMEINDPHVVKVVGSPIDDDRLRALYFTRATAPWGDGPLYHHIGLYAYRRDALARYVGLLPSPLEQRERLEQLRALEAGMRIDVRLVDSVPLGVDTPRDLDKARAIMS